MFQSNNFKINRSSAGSGKTYNLCMNFILIALVGSQKFSPEYFKKILAITFTNKAASEMKSRILEYLECLSLAMNKDGTLDWLLTRTSLTDQQLISNAQKVRTSILHNYSDLKISTIDKFNYDLVRIFSRDLGLTTNFELELDNDKIIRAAVSNLLSKINESGNDLSNTLLDFAMQNLEDGKSVDIQRSLEDFSINLFSEESYQHVSNSNSSIKDCMNLKKILLNKKNNILKKVNLISLSINKVFSSNGFVKEDFIRGSFYIHFTNNLNDTKSWMPSEYIQKNISNNIWYSESLHRSRKKLIQSHKKTFISLYNDLMKLVKNYNSYDAILSSIHSIALLNELLIEINEHKNQMNIEQISVFNKKIHDLIVEQSSAFIYERIGARFNHFLIDEFQDTSVLQWQNLLPLIVDSLDYGSCFIVGDGKQSIYRWRGGEVQQFLELPSIYKSDNLMYSSEWENKIKSHYSNDFVDNQNYRSRKKIIDFNNSFFEKLKLILNKKYITIYDQSKQKSDFSTNGGYIRIDFFSDNLKTYKQQILDAMLHDVVDLIDNKSYKYSDIAILCNSKKSISMVAESLNRNKIPVISNESLLINFSEHIQAVVTFLRCILDEDDKFSKLRLVFYLENKFKNKLSVHDINKKISNDITLKELLQLYSVSFDKSYLLKLPLYQLIVDIYKILSIPEDAYTSFFLDAVLSFMDKSEEGIHSFIIWWDENKDKNSIVVPEEINAVNIMTIHKSKGLAFNIVMIPFNWEGTRNSSEIWVDTDMITNFKLRSSIIKSSSKLLHSDFHKEYLQEKDLSLLDKINKLYVAMTRPIQRLHIYSKEIPKKITNTFLKSGRLNSLLYSAGIRSNFTFGLEVEINQDDYQDGSDLFTIKKLNNINWRNHVSLKSSLVRTWDQEGMLSKQKWGKLVHYALSLIEKSEDIEICCNKLYLQGLCDKTDKVLLVSKIDEIISHPDISCFFTSKWKTITEKEILLPNGLSYIPDRILISKDTTVILDYKTGMPNIIHHQQILNYEKILSDMGYSNIEKYLVYTESENMLVKL